MECSWFTEVRGTHPQTGEQIDEWGCAVTWMPVLLIDNTQQQRQTGAAVESFRNETVKKLQDSVTQMKIKNSSTTNTFDINKLKGV